MYKISTYRIDPRPLRDKILALNHYNDGEERNALRAELEAARVGGCSLNTTGKFLSVEDALHFTGLVLLHARSKAPWPLFAEEVPDKVWVEVEQWYFVMERVTQEFEIPE